jgi:amino acid adenylation domain-containing protein
MAMLIHELLAQAGARWPNHPAVEEEGGGAISYRALVDLSDQVRDRLSHLGVEPGDRVGVYLRKSIDAVAAIFGILKAGAAYVPVDPGAPLTRNAYILNDCSVKAVVLEERFVAALREEVQANTAAPAFLVMSGAGGGRPLQEALERAQLLDPAPPVTTATVEPDHLAYILYTSGSTGKPKGVMLSHRNAASFIDWCSEAFEPQASDRFSSHAPFHFDLSILDLYVPIKHGATVVLIGAETGKEPARLAAFIADRRISSWYSTPSVLSLLAQYGKMGQQDYSALRTVLFAGEVFPIKHLRTLKALWPKPRYFNLYGPTETNVCTYFEIPAHVPEERSEPYPIGQTCSHLQAIVVDEHARAVSMGQEGELCISGPGVMRGYWNLPERTAQVFLNGHADRRWYKTGDIVVQAQDGNFTYVGRRDRMVKKRGYRVELGEIEAGLYRHPAVKEAAVVALMDEEYGVRVKAFLCCKEAEPRPTIIELKCFCADQLPNYMVPDLFAFRDVLPKTSTDKVDYQMLAVGAD